MRRCSTLRERGWRAVWLAACLAIIVPAAGAWAERLPVRMLTTVDGLPHNMVNAILRDSRGFVWFCTREGLSRFDGHGFVNYGVHDGLPSGVINAMIEVNNGLYWIATSRGLVLFDPSAATTIEGPPTARRMFTAFLAGTSSEAQFVTSVHRDAGGRLWIGTLDGLYLAELADDRKRRTVSFNAVLASAEVTTITEDANDMWIGTSRGLFTLRHGGGVRQHTAKALDAHVTSTWSDGPGRLWIGTTSGLHRLTLASDSDRVGRVDSFGKADGLPVEWITQIRRMQSGQLWVATNGGIARLEEQTPIRFKRYELSSSIGALQTLSMAEDGDHLWLGTSRGVARAATAGFSIFDSSSGIANAGAIFTTSQHGVLVMGADAHWQINWLDGDRFVPVRIPRAHVEATWGWNQVTLLDHSGAWWTGTRQGVLRFDGVTRPQDLATRAPSRRYTQRDGLPSDVVLRLFEDSSGDVWVSTVGEGRAANGLSRWRRSRDQWTSFETAPGLPSLFRYYASSFAETRGGSVWVGFSGDGGLVRHRHGTLQVFDADDGVPPGAIRNLLVDSRGDLWAASYRNGLIRVIDPDGSRPRIQSWNTASGLPSNEVSALAEDLDGRIYAGSARGVIRLDPASGGITHYSSVESLGEFQGGVRDVTGAIWFSCTGGLLRFRPDEVNRPRQPGQTYVTGLRLNAQPHVVSAIGETRISGLRFAAGINLLDIDFVAPSGADPNELYQIKLEGADGAWSAPSSRRSVSFANLAPGNYRFVVRAVGTDRTSDLSSDVELTIVPPMWRRGWFLGSAAAASSALVLLVHRRRERRRRAIAAIRTRIAGDLHDDIGANLTRIAVLSEVAQRHGGVAERADASLASIGRIARESVITMGDIIWAVNPREDDLLELGRKLREYGGEVCTAAGVQFSMSVPGPGRYDRLPLDVRRDLYLIFKEAVTNAVRHASCTALRVCLSQDQGTIALEIVDNGRGLDQPIFRAGHGLDNMQRRATRLGARFHVGAAAPGGTIVRIECQTRRRGHLFR